MVKRLKAMAQAASTDQELAEAVKSSAQQIWLAGLGAFAKAQVEGQKLFDALVKEGGGIQRRAVKAAETGVDQITDRVSGLARQIQQQTTGAWDKLETAVESRALKALDRLGIPSRQDVQQLTKKVEALTAAVHALSASPSRTTPKKTPKRPMRTAKPTKASAAKGAKKAR
ncbi:MAG TPA: phasin family protein [Burkholderiaceae bacterium]|nr:phasin family protein [Burkholderiaceae bacterium]